MADPKGMIGHWPFQEDVQDTSTSRLTTANENVGVGPAPPGGPTPTAARFNGLDSRLIVEDHPALHLGTGDFTISVWLHTEVRDGDVVGDILSRFDPDRRRGFGLGVVTNSGVTSTSQSNYRNLQFGIDQGRIDGVWADHGRPGNAVLIKALHVSEGELYAGTFETEARESGHLWHYERPGCWQDLGGCPDGSNTVPSIVRFDGDLYCSTGRYKAEGSALPVSKSLAPGGRVYRIGRDGEWIDCGHPGAEDATPEDQPTSGYETGKADMAGALTVWGGALYAITYYRLGVFQYEGGRSWKPVGPHLRLISLAICRRSLYGLANGGGVFRYLGEGRWEDCGTPPGSTQTYGGAIYAGDFYVGTWPEGEVARYDGGRSWTRIGRAGYEREIMGIAVYNQKLYIGSLPMANVWRMDGNRFRFVGNVDNTATVFLRRAWSMAVYDGRLFVGTLPAGRVMSLQAGAVATGDSALPGGWSHLAAIRDGRCLRLYLDGRPLANSPTFRPDLYDLTQSLPMYIGFGGHTFFHGAMSDLRLYNRALTEDEVRTLARL